MDAIRQLLLRWMTAALVLTVRLTVTTAGEHPALPDGWRELSAKAFADLVRPFYDLEEEKVIVPMINDELVRAHAMRFASKLDFSDPRLDLSTLNLVHMLASKKLEPNVQSRIKNRLLARQEKWEGRPYSELRAKWDLMYRLKVSPGLRLAEGRRWANAGGQLAEVPLSDIPEAYPYFVPEEPQIIDGGFEVRWEGQIVPPRTAEYSFSFSPVNANSEDNEHRLSIAMTAAVGGIEVLRATSAHWSQDSAESWTTASKPVALTAQTPAPIVVNFKADVGDAPPARSLHAVLEWEAQGIPKSVIAASRFVLPDGKASGLRATYRWRARNGQRHEFSRVEQQIDVAWMSWPVYLVDARPMDKTAVYLWQAATSPEFLSALTNGQDRKRTHPFFQDPEGTGGLLSSQQRHDFLRLLESRPELLDHVSLKSIARFYAVFRLGDLDAALAAFVTWAQRHRDLGPELPQAQGFEADSRSALQRLAVNLTLETPTQGILLLETHALESPGGFCVLPVAYALAYCHLGTDKLQHWTEYLDHRLADSSLKGDRRVNWLLARALAEEISVAPPRLYVNVDYRVDKGFNFLDLAKDCAESSQVKLRVAMERASRFAALQEFDAALAELKQAERLAASDGRVLMAGWEIQIEGLKERYSSTAAVREEVVHQAYLDTLRRRRAAAVRRKDAASIKHYDALIHAAEKR